MINIFDIAWDSEFKTYTSSLRQIDKNNDLANFICPIIQMLAHSNLIDEFIETQCIPSIKESLDKLNQDETKNIIVAPSTLIQSSFTPSWMLIYQIYIKIYLKEKYNIKAFIGAVDRELMAVLDKNSL